MTPTVALSIAGSDSGGGAGLQADLKTFAAFGVHGTFALTAITAQNTTEVRAVQVLDPSFVVAQVEAVVDDLEVRAAKTGMLATAGIVAVVGELAAEGRLPHLVVDPVLVSSTGHQLMDEGGVDAYRRLLLPHAEVATPNLREAALLTGRHPESLTSIEAMTEAAEALRALGARTVVVKGGHFGAGAGAETRSPDVVAGPQGTYVLEAARVSTGNDHGTGCSLSAAIAANLALGRPVDEAIVTAKDWVGRAIAAAAGWRLGAGHGPINHFLWPADGGVEPPS
jgi:hydroxymethylpyrimidine/phosphomethylpyrimidine kinase